ncbi:winged helix-turn-helix domain-containing protein [Photobacterium swingsii]|uniref:winged helix-turn-helix domain-containing protein n=1 Tax=Photobacterium swingsii TaxID=680026 RepID=UPI004067D84B
MSQAEQIKFPTGVCFIPSLGIIKSDNATQELNQSERCILNYLLAHSHRPSTKQALIKAGWPEREVTEASLFQVIRSLRIKLQESKKGEIIETVPRLGYQICHFEVLALGELPHDKKTNKSSRTKRISYSFLAVICVFVIIIVLFKYESSPTLNLQDFHSRQISLDTNEILVVGKDDDVLDDLTSKMNALYQSYNALHSPRILENHRLYIYKNEDIYSIAWCELDDDNTCIKGTDLSYSMRLKDWPTFENYILSNEEELKDTAKIQTDFARQPAAKVFLNYIDDSKIQSKVIHYFISNEPNNAFKYSSISYIANKNSKLHHVLSIKAANYQAIPTDDIPNVMAYIKITPEMFHWAYQPNKTNSLNQSSLALENEKHEQVIYDGRQVAFNHLLYHHNHLSLIFCEKSGLYWVHATNEQDVLFKTAID